MKRKQDSRYSYVQGPDKRLRQKLTDEPDILGDPDQPDEPDVLGEFSQPDKAVPELHLCFEPIGNTNKKYASFIMEWEDAHLLKETYPRLVLHWTEQMRGKKPTAVILAPFVSSHTCESILDTINKINWVRYTKKERNQPFEKQTEFPRIKLSDKQIETFMHPVELLEVEYETESEYDSEDTSAPESSKSNEEGKIPWDEEAFIQSLNDRN